MFSCHIGQTSEIQIDGALVQPSGFFETGTCAPAARFGCRGVQSVAISLAFQLWARQRKSRDVSDGFQFDLVSTAGYKNA